MKNFWKLQTWYIDNIRRPYQRFRTKLRAIRYKAKMSNFGEKMGRLYHKLYLRRKVRKLNAVS